MFKRLFVCALIAVLILGITACKSVFGDSAQFNSLEELKIKLGSELLYPGALPESFNYDTQSFKGFEYKESGTWEYSISFSNSRLTEQEDREALPSGRFEIQSINLRSYEPVHEPPTDAAGFAVSSQYKITEFENDLQNADASIHMVIEGVDVIFDKGSWHGDGTGDVPYMYTNPTASFIYNGILYTIHLAIYANNDDDFMELKAYGREMTMFMVHSLLENR